MADEQHCEDEHGHDDDHGGGGGGGNTDFLDLEISKVLYSEAEGVTREAFRELLKDAAKRQWQARFGDQIDALAKLAVDELLADVTTNLEIEAKIAARQAAREGVDAKVSALLGGDSGSDADGE
ncbi:hypothetical protein PPSIR1_00235 [Plesiocystis pacifica SIR-1]|uniref:Uncharacterized protein n=1 Tax=Plesiocystis pacifica SIR-1 TaxID=391625 RepID=A6GEW2_9BACT|nr:hypothetical protein [Plesiocystis pacifica]EDM75624.1 hypothetical protein PPSIR1_00235 [Plesiocystis pacifica SIR-1]